MAIIHIQMDAQRESSDGSHVQIAPKHALLSRGPIIQVSVMVISSVAQQVIQQGGIIPNPVSGYALIDTGASTTCIDDTVARKIGAPAIDKVKMCSASHTEADAFIYPVNFEILGANIPINVPRCMGAALQGQELVMLIGRDVLEKCTLHYNGISGQFTLSL